MPVRRLPPPWTVEELDACFFVTDSAGQKLAYVLNEHFEEDSAIVFREACKLGCEGIVSKTAWLALSLGTFSALGEGQKPESASSHTRGRGGLGPVMGTAT
jgi:hypothetical protein